MTEPRGIRPQGPLGRRLPSSQNTPPQRDVADGFVKAGGKPLSMSVSEARGLVQRDVERWSRLVRTIGIKPD